MLTGGGSQIYGMEELLEESTGIRTTTVDDPLSVVAIGTGRYAEFIEGMGELAAAHSAVRNVKISFGAHAWYKEVTAWRSFRDWWNI